MNENLEEAVVNAAKEELTKEISPKEKCIRKSAEMREKYADVINDLTVKYNLPDGNGFEYLKAIARSVIFNEPCDYSADIEFNLDELVADERELLSLSEQAINI